MRRAFHALGENRNLQALRQDDRRAHDRHRLRAGVDVGDEGAVDLDLVEGKVLQGGERGVAGAIVVHRDLHAPGFQLAHDGEGMVVVLDDARFGDFQFEARGGKTGGCQDLVDHPGQVRLRNLRRGDIDGDLVGLGPARGFGAGFPQHPFADGQDQTRLLGQRNELDRRDEAALWVIPPNENLEADQIARGDVVLGLVVELQLLAFDRVAQFQRQGGAGAVRLVHGRIVAADAGEGRLLGAVHGQIGSRQERRGVRCVVRIISDAKAGADRQDAGFVLDVPADDAVEPGGEFERLALLVEPGLDRDEFVAADTCEEFAILKAGGEALGDDLQDHVAGRVAMHVVDVLEAVEVDADHGDARGVVIISADDLGELARQVMAVRQARHGIMQGKLAIALDGLDLIVVVDQVARQAGAHDQRHDSQDAEDEEAVRDALFGHGDGEVRHERQSAHAGEVHRHDAEDQRQCAAIAAKARDRTGDAVHGDGAKECAQKDGDGDEGRVPAHRGRDAHRAHAGIVHDRDADAQNGAADLDQCRGARARGNDHADGAKADRQEERDQRDGRIVDELQRGRIAHHGDEVRCPDRAAGDDAGKEQPVGAACAGGPPGSREQPHRHDRTSHADRGRQQHVSIVMLVNETREYFQHVTTLDAVEAHDTHVWLTSVGIP